MVRSYSPMCTLASSMCLSEVEESCAAALQFRTPKRGRASLMTPNSHVSPIVVSFRFLPSHKNETEIEKEKRDSHLKLDTTRPTSYTGHYKNFTLRDPDGNCVCRSKGLPLTKLN
ncbi:unnamed protein product [Nezara viridula]|uniref:Uncharacterized protein n=1 Tax=Nezara viridula TaxID=85310 RepID=A0A9P0MLB7_NEZVI|nr:unnamed protein product [Nezara viridula]